MLSIPNCNVPSTHATTTAPARKISGFSGPPWQQLPCCVASGLEGFFTASQDPWKLESLNDLTASWRRLGGSLPGVAQVQQRTLLTQQGASRLRGSASSRPAAQPPRHGTAPEVLPSRTGQAADPEGALRATGAAPPCKQHDLFPVRYMLHVPDTAGHAASPST